MIEDGKCPFCGSGNDNPIHFRISSAFTNRILSDIILEQTQEKKKNLLLLYLMVKNTSLLQTADKEQQKLRLK